MLLKKCIWKCHPQNVGHLVESSLCLRWGSTPHLQRHRLHRSVDYQETERIHHISSPELTLEANCVVFAPEMCRTHTVMDVLVVTKYRLVFNYSSDDDAHMILQWRHMSITASKMAVNSIVCNLKRIRAHQSSTFRTFEYVYITMTS